MKISVTRALAELKNLGDKVERAVSQGVFVAATKGQNEKKVVLGTTGKTVDDTVNLIKGSYDKVEALIRNREILKGAIVMSNANTNVSLRGKTFTVAEAIEMKSTVAIKERYLGFLAQQFNANRINVAKQNDAVDKAIEAALTTVYGNDKGKVEASMYEAIAAPQKKIGEANLLDPCNIQAKLDALRDEVDAIKTELDFVLSEANARTEIEVDLKGV